MPDVHRFICGCKGTLFVWNDQIFRLLFCLFFSRYLSVPLWHRLCWGHSVASDSQKMSLCIVFPADGFHTSDTGNQQPTLSTMVICRVWVGMFRGRSQSLVNPQWSFAGCGLAGARGRFQFIVRLQVDCVGNSLIINALHASTVGAGFIPALAAADENSSNYPAAGKMGITTTPISSDVSFAPRPLSVGWG